jgi:DNA-binding winged helix-turn-helix (wHTH) protein
MGDQPYPKNANLFFADTDIGGSGLKYRFEKRGKDRDLLLGETNIHEEEKVFELLEYLLFRSGKRLLKRDVHEALWGEPEDLGGNLDTCLRKLRNILRDTAPWRLVESPRRKYIKFAPPVQIVPLPDTDAPEVSGASLAGEVLSSVSSSGRMVTSLPLTTLSDFPTKETVRPDHLLPLLQARYRAIPFVGRGEERESLWEWLNAPGQVSFRAIVGHGGRGKTRLAIGLLELLEERVKNRWHAGLLEAPFCKKTLTGKRFWRWDGDKPTLIVVDDAAIWADTLEDVVRAVRTPRENCPPLRFLLIDRGADEDHGWYSKLRTAAVTDLKRLFPHPPLRLVELDHLGDSDLAERCQVLKDALSMLSTLTGQPELTLDETAMERLSDVEMGDPLVLFMAAIVGHELGDLSPLAWRRIDLADALAAREEIRITSLARPKTEFLPLHMAASVTLAGGLGRDDLLATCRQERKAIDPESSWSPLELAKLIEERALPSDDATTAAAPIVPDIVGEVFVARIFRDPYQRSSDTVLRAFRSCPQTVMRSLVRMIQDFAPTSETPQALQRQQQPVDWLAALLQVTGSSFDEVAFWEVFRSLRSGSIATNEIARRFYRTLASTPNVSPWVHALTMRELAGYEYAARRHEDALLCAAEAVDECRKLVDWNPDSFLHHLVISLIIKQNVLQEMGRVWEALRCSEEAVTLCRDQTERDRNAPLDSRPVDGDADLATLAQSLENYAEAMRRVGHPKKALDAIQEAIQYSQELTHKDRDRFLPRLASSFLVRSSIEGDLDRNEEALISAEIAVNYYRQLVHRNADQHLADLAGALCVKANHELNVDRRSEACLSNAEALKIRRYLTRRNRPGFLGGLAAALAMQATLETETEAAIEANREAIECWLELLKTSRPTYLLKLARALNVQAVLFDKLGDTSEAHKFNERSLDHCRELMANNRTASLPVIANVLWQQASLLNKDRKTNEALASITEAIKYGKELVRDNPREFLPRLAASYYVWAEVLNADGNPECVEKLAETVRLIKPCALIDSNHWRKAQKTAHEFRDAAQDLDYDLNPAFLAPFLTFIPASVQPALVYREVISQTPAAYLPDLARDLANKKELGVEARNLAREATERYQALQRGGPSALLQDRARALEKQAKQCLRIGRTREALDSHREAIPFLRLLAQESPPTFFALLASALLDQGMILAKNEPGEAPEALDCINEAIDRYRSLVARDRGQFLRPLVDGLMAKVGCLFGLEQANDEQKEDMLAAISELVDHCIELARETPERFLPTLTTAYAYWGAVLWNYDNPADRKPADAAGKFLAALNTISPLALQDPGAFSAIALQVFENYVSACHAAALEPEPQVLELVAKIAPPSATSTRSTLE